MPASPDFDAFAARYAVGEPQVVSIRLVADLETPVSAMLKLAGDKPNSFLLESVEGGATRGRYSFIGFAPDLIWRCDGGRAAINRNPDDDPAQRVSTEPTHTLPVRLTRPPYTS